MSDLSKVGQASSLFLHRQDAYATIDLLENND
jgi:hypothetical protein